MYLFWAGDSILTCVSELVVCNLIIYVSITITALDFTTGSLHVMSGDIESVLAVCFRYLVVA